ncbi:nucleoside triphosphate pyrophosphohydrolase [Bermanella marisrubri]|uniref:Nucleoside triphosphate pyrophosphohydrolase n=1 Tax=Bermanella marisrubri TaxID=207949 RepID=Q1MXN9_9GAMM|nr:nucleoside triphosphate pyrophosphohydrolase [Bermanella marisrubri]EAT10745.1 predicted pyrophosphatase [Oceanobacter sp. RED65] [Bermanella marisrubri]QIZ83606.1 nucleoside triphosphate pyrophosphohydrolase [Bermanella marisrubri]
MTQYTVDDLLYLMERLRDPQTGCPWDIKQTFDSIVPYTLEEVYEVVDAIESKDYGHLKEELGDLLFQIIFYAQIGKESNYFAFTDIVHTLVDKLVRRHPHVFPSGSLHAENRESELGEAEIKANWEKIKQQERNEKAQLSAAQSKSSVLDDIPHALPALQRAEKLQKRASTQGFDWSDPMPVIDKIEEEISELREAINSGRQEHIQDELGDVFFAVANLSRHLGVKSEVALRSTNNKFTRRFQFVESELAKQGITLSEAGLQQMDALWDEAKKRGL